MNCKIINHFSWIYLLLGFALMLQGKQFLCLLNMQHFKFVIEFSLQVQDGLWQSFKDYFWNFGFLSFRNNEVKYPVLLVFKTFIETFVEGPLLQKKKLLTRILLMYLKLMLILILMILILKETTGYYCQ